MMTRREMLVRMFGATVTAAIAPFINLQDATPAFWNQESIKKLLPWKITFPDGATYSFDATVLEEKLLASLDGLTELSLRVQPTGPMTVSAGAPPLDTGGLRASPMFTPTVLEVDGRLLMELQEIEMPSLDRGTSEMDGSYSGGLRRMGNLTLTVKF